MNNGPIIHTALVVDDVDINRYIASRLLENFAVNVHCAMNGQEAIEKCGSLHYDLVLMDIQMPLFDGIQATKIIREHEKEYDKIPVCIIALTAYGEYKKQCLEVGMNAFLTKPLSFDKLKTIIYEYVLTKPEKGV